MESITCDCENKIPILVFAITEHDGFANIFRGNGRYTIVTEAS